VHGVCCIPYESAALPYKSVLRFHTRGDSTEGAVPFPSDAWRLTARAGSQDGAWSADWSLRRARDALVVVIVGAVPVIGVGASVLGRFLLDRQRSHGGSGRTNASGRCFDVLC
jgi:hypothetical protein